MASCGEPLLSSAGAASIRLTHGAQLAPLEYNHVQAVAVICISSQAEEKRGGGGEVALKAGTLAAQLQFWTSG